MKTIQILTGRYLPGHKDGGPLRTLVNLTDALGDEYHFRIAALDRDHGDTKAYPNIIFNEWNRVGKAGVWYVPPKGFSFRFIRALAKSSDLVYTCGFYDNYGYKTLILHRLGLLYHKPVVIASMGVFSQGALSQKSFKKKSFIALCKFFGLFKNVVWSVTSELEAEDLKRVIGKNVRYQIAEDLPRTEVPGKPREAYNNEVFQLAFLSRICRKKNLLGAIHALSMVTKRVHFNVYGPIEDADYYRQCEDEIKKLPQNITWEYHGDVSSELVQQVLQENDAFILPTLGENYGHVIFEALSVGCIPIISDQTPWQSITEKDAGYIIPVNATEEYVACIEELTTMDINRRISISENAISIAKEKVEQARRKTGYRKIFESC